MQDGGEPVELFTVTFMYVLCHPSTVEVGEKERERKKKKVRERKRRKKVREKEF